MIAELYECQESIADMEIAFEQKAMQVISRIPARREAEKRVAEVLDALAVLAPEVNIASRRDVERDEFERRPEVFRPVRAILVARNVIIAQEVIGRLRIPQHLCAEAAWGGKKRRQLYYDRDGARCAGSPWRSCHPRAAPPASCAGDGT
jgi:galactokinase